MPWNAAQTKVRSKLGIQRIRTLIEKNEALAKRSRREVASLLEVGKVETARIRTESLILQDTHNELLELLELYLELILARFGLLEINNKEKEPEEGIREAVCSIVYAAPRCEIRELHIVREAFMSRYGRDWAVSVMENTHSHVPPRMVSKCKTETPPKDWVDLYLYEIAKAYQVDWRPEGFVDLEYADAKDGEADTAAQEERLLEAKLSSDPVNGEGKPKKPADGEDDNDDDGNGGGDDLLPSAPSGDPKLGSIWNSTTHIPVIRPKQDTQPPSTPSKTGSGSAAESSKASELFDLPSTPPLDPAQSARTVVIKSNLGSVQQGKEEPAKPAPATSGDPSYDDLARRFEALKRK